MKRICSHQQGILHCHHYPGIYSMLWPSAVHNRRCISLQCWRGITDELVKTVVATLCRMDLVLVLWSDAWCLEWRSISVQDGACKTHSVQASVMSVHCRGRNMLGITVACWAEESVLSMPAWYTGITISGNSSIISFILFFLIVQLVGGRR